MRLFLPYKALSVNIGSATKEANHKEVKKFQIEGN